jgi:hypothetical protein
LPRTFQVLAMTREGRLVEFVEFVGLVEIDGDSLRQMETH